MRQREIERFLYREARYMDEHRYQEWLALWADDAVYWVPYPGDTSDPHRQVSIIYDDRSKLADRAAYLEHGTLREPEMRPWLSRVVSNIEAKPANGGGIEVESNFVLIEARDGQQYFWAGRSIHRLCLEGSTTKIRFKKVLLVNSAQPMPVMHFLV
jgi:benzoate/toluate 1,2-dioxygenase beta subunit